MRACLVLIAITACAAPPPPVPPVPPPPPPAHAAPPAAAAHAHRPVVIAVLGLIGDPPSAQLAADLTLYLRNAAREDAHAQLADNREALDEELMFSCTDEAPACMAKIGESLHADHVLYGRVAGPTVSLRLLDVAHGDVRAWNGTATAERAAREALAAGAYAELTATLP